MLVQSSLPSTQQKTSTAACQDQIDTFTQTDWEFQLDVEPNPSIEFLKQHLNRVPADEAQGETAVWLSNHILSLEH